MDAIASKSCDRSVQNFLYLLYLYPNRTLVPTQEIDQVWRRHILDTRKYAQDCQWLFDYFVHHYPYFGIGTEAEKPALEMAFSCTQTLFTEHFGIDLAKNIYDLKMLVPLYPKVNPTNPVPVLNLSIYP